jgi:UDP-3-O-[3-hydroxymyristoyl] glucosamine N-acyltransferase
LTSDRTAFFGAPTSHSLKALFDGLQVNVPSVYADIDVRDCKDISAAGQGVLTYLSDLSYLEGRLPEGSICLVSHKIADISAEGFEKAVILACDNPRAAFAQAAQRIYPALYNPSADRQAAIHPTAIIDPQSQIDKTASIGAFCVIEKDVKIGAHSVLESHIQLKQGTEIGRSCHIAASAVISHAIIADHVRIGANTVIGKRGFGFEASATQVSIMPHLGIVLVGNYVDIGASCVIDRAVFGETRLDDYVMLDNLVHLAHNVTIGTGTIIAAHSAVAGSSHIGKACMLGGKVGVADHVTIGDNSIIMGNANVTKSLAGGEAYAGFPAMPAQQFWRQQARLRIQAKQKQR